MTIENISRLLAQKEGTTLEFKECRNKLPESVFETICSFLNREGGTIILGVNDYGEIIGIEHDKVDEIMKHIVNLSNNPQKLSPPYILFPKHFSIDGKDIISIQIPVSSQVHRAKGVVYDRSNDGDYAISEPERIASIFNQKKIVYTENMIFKGLKFEHFKPDLFPKMRNLIRSKTPGHPWLQLTDEQILKIAGFYKTDIQQNIEGYSLAAALMFGEEHIIQSAVPHYKIDALVRRENVDRYDDRLNIRVNLIDAYDLLMEFVAKHLPDNYFLEGTLRISLRDKIFHEIIANILVHREYTNALPTTFTIYKDRVETINANNPHGQGLLVPDNFIPFPKNPVISKFFMQMGRAEELGSGVLNVNKYLKHYIPGAKPQFQEGVAFKIIIPLDVKRIGDYAGYIAEMLNINFSSHELSEIEQIPLSYDLSKYYGDTTNCLLYLGSSWSEKGAKLISRYDLKINEIENFEDWKGASWSEKGVKLLDKSVRNVVIILFSCLEGKTRTEVQNKVQFGSRDKLRTHYINPLLQNGTLALSNPDKPNSPLQKYITTEKGKLFLGGFEVD